MADEHNPRVRLTANIHEFALAYLEMEAQASDPFNSFVYGDAEHQRPVGMMSCLNPSDLRRVRLRSARALQPELQADESLTNRIRLAGQSRLALEVSSTAILAMALCLGNGFVEPGRHRVDDPETGRALERVRRLAME